MDEKTIQRLTFETNMYQGKFSPTYAGEVADMPSVTESGQSNNVRQILERFAREGVNNVPPDNRSAYLAEFSDDEPLDSPVIDNLLHTPDLSNMDEMEIVDYIRESSEETDISSLQKSIEKSEDPPNPGSNPGSTQESATQVNT